ncbi:MAG TPA: type IV toxin-antitoxin system AbiEi family antitoxin domain-containing protein [Microlunatus sp.]
MDPSDRLRALAADQAGVISSKQAFLLGLSRESVRRLARDHHWQRLTPGVFHLGVGNPSWLARAWAGILLGGSDARLGFAAAGHAWGLVAEPPEECQVLVPVDRQVAARGCWTFPRERPGVREQRSQGSPPCTSIADTAIDLCATVDEPDIEDVLTRAVQGRRVSAQELLQRARARPRVRHRSAILALLGEVREGAESVLELRYLNDVERAHGLPTATRQHRSRNGKDVRDALYEEYSTIVELDGDQHVLRQLRDMQRDNRALVSGKVSLRYGWHDVTGRSCQVAWEVAAVLVSRGWSGLPTRCPRCEHATGADLKSV